MLLIIMNIFSSGWQFITGLPAEVTGSAIALVSGLILKAIPNDKIQASIYKFMYGLGVTVTLGASQIKALWFAKAWKATIEAYVIDAIDNIIIHGLRGFVAGLRSDNKNKADKVNGTEKIY